MGKEGDQLTKDSTRVAELLLNQLAALGAISAKKMFGGHDIFYEGKMFAMVDSKGIAYLKADDSNRNIFENIGLEKHYKMPYYALSEKHLQDEVLLHNWAKTSIEIAKNK